MAREEIKEQPFLTAFIGRRVCIETVKEEYDGKDHMGNNHRMQRYGMVTMTKWEMTAYEWNGEESKL